MFKKLPSEGSFAKSRKPAENVDPGRKDLILVEIIKAGFTISKKFHGVDVELELFFEEGGEIGRGSQIERKLNVVKKIFSLFYDDVGKSVGVGSITNDRVTGLNKRAENRFFLDEVSVVDRISGGKSDITKS